MEVLDEHAAALESRVRSVSRRNPEKDEIRFARKSGNAVDAGELAVELRALGSNSACLFCEELFVLKGFPGDELRKHADIIGEPHFLDMVEPLARARDKAESQARETRFGQRAHHEEIRLLAQA